MERAIRKQRPGAFSPPAGVVFARIDKTTGKLAAPGQLPETTLNEVFLDGTAPTEQAPAPGELDPSQLVLEPLEGDAPTPEAEAPPPPTPQD